MKNDLISAFIIIMLVAILITQCVGINSIVSKLTPDEVETTQQVDVTVTSTTSYTEPTTDIVTEVPTTETQNKKPETVQEIIDQYTLLVDKFKQQKPAYKRKEFQALPEEYHNFSPTINKGLDIAAGYMTTEDEAIVVSRDAGSVEILKDMPIHDSEKGCVLTDYDAVEWAKCEDKGDGTYEISFSLKREYNCEPTPSDTLIPVSAHGAVMQPSSMSHIIGKVDAALKKIPGVTLNHLDLAFNDCVFSCVYNPETDEVLSITHYIAVDMLASGKVFGNVLDGSARLINEMYIFDITW